MATKDMLRSLGLPVQLADLLGGDASTMGSATINGTTEVTCSCTALTSSHDILLLSKTVGGTPGAVYVSSRTNGTGFGIKSTNASDTGSIRWMIVKNA